MASVSCAYVSRKKKNVAFFFWGWGGGGGVDMGNAKEV